jgi:DNA-binding LytR/AlgR family response regulator
VPVPSAANSFGTGSRFEGSVSGSCVEAEVITEAEDVTASDSSSCSSSALARRRHGKLGCPAAAQSRSISSLFDFQNELKADIRIPIIFITAHGDAHMSVRAMKAGVVDFMTKPFRDQDLLDALATAIECDRKRREDEKGVAELKSKLETLTPRKLEVMGLIHCRFDEQASDRRDRRERDHSQGSRRPRHAQNGRAVALVRMAEIFGISRQKT